MKRGKAKRWRGEEDTATVFLRGFLAAGLLTAIRDRLDPDEPPANSRKVLRHAIQGGCALSAATVAARALTRNDYAQAAIAAGLGAAGLIAAEQALRPVGATTLPAHIEEPASVEEEEE